MPRQHAPSCQVCSSAIELLYLNVLLFEFVFFGTPKRVSLDKCIAVIYACAMCSLSDRYGK